MSLLSASLARSCRWLPPLLVSLLCLQTGCKKKQQSATEQPELSSRKSKRAKRSKSKKKANKESAPIEQIADPEPVKNAADLYWKGGYEDIVSALEPALPNWSEPNKQRASGLAHGWIALAHAEQLPENAQAHVETASQIAQNIEDDEVETLAQIANALSLVAMAQAQEAYDLLTHLSEPSDLELQRLLYIAQAKIAINLAFDAQERLAHPEKLDEAEQSYRKVRPYQGDHGNALMGHVHEGLAAIAKFRGQSAMMCEQAKKARVAYKEGSASELLQSGPVHMLNSGGCK